MKKIATLNTTLAASQSPHYCSVEECLAARKYPLIMDGFIRQHGLGVSTTIQFGSILPISVLRIYSEAYSVRLVSFLKIKTADTNQVKFVAYWEVFIWVQYIRLIVKIVFLWS